MLTKNINNSERIKQISAAVIGNAMEWYDFVIFGFFATIFSQLFFPRNDERAALLLTLATFGVGFCSRPIGGLFFGLYADKNGRKSALQLVILLMTIAVALIAFAPIYASAGLFGPIMIVVGRLLQGFATGGEFSTSTSFLIEVSPPQYRGFFGSLQMAGQALSILLGTLVGIVVTAEFTNDQIESWAWRIPFILGLLIGPIGLYIRRHLSETEEFEKSERKLDSKKLFITLINSYPAKLAGVFGTTISATIYFYIILIYMPTFAKAELHLNLSQSFISQGIGLVILVILTPVVGLLSDVIGRRPILIISNILFLITAYPLFVYLIDTHSQNSFTLVQVIFCTILSGIFGVLSTVLAEQFPTNVRSTGLALPYNMAVMIFGGFAPMIVTLLIGELHSLAAPSYYLIFGALAGLISSKFLVDSNKTVHLELDSN